MQIHLKWNIFKMHNKNVLTDISNHRTVTPKLKTIFYLVYKHRYLEKNWRFALQNVYYIHMHIDIWRKLSKNKIHVIKRDYIWKFKSAAQCTRIRVQSEILLYSKRNENTSSDFFLYDYQTSLDNVAGDLIF